MARQQTTSLSLISIMGAALVALGLAILFGNLVGPAVPATTALDLLLSLVPAAWRAFEAFAFDHQWFSPCPLQMLAAFWPLLHVVAGAA